MTRMRLLAFAALTLPACDPGPGAPTPQSTETATPAGIGAETRWYSPEQVAAGAPLYAEHCAACHKANAQGTADWKSRDANGKLPPPPLNGTAHTWHHPLEVLRMVVRQGGGQFGGSMPGFAETLSAGQIDAILAWIQSHWSDEIYALWHQRDVATRRAAR